MFQCYSLKSPHPCPLPQSPKDCSIHLCLFCCLAYHRYHFSKFHIYALVYCIDVFRCDFTLYNRLQFHPPPILFASFPVLELLIILLSAYLQTIFIKDTRVASFWRPCIWSHSLKDPLDKHWLNNEFPNNWELVWVIQYFKECCFQDCYYLHCSKI